MTRRQYTTKNGAQWAPLFTKEFERACFDGVTGFCLACGADTDGVEPDARRYQCRECEQFKVYGLEELLVMGLVKEENEHGS